ncbi:LysR family transcriptional regulator [Pigmentiphaga litoralis]|uniref:LysR family transcriptional regulator n=1 Tax=Pigmentiphaga litoralis TaxID=516702 RepID=UPI0016746DA2|nr:LysR family transcriptional regulator [Pigmentiphaga litoralis]GGX17864.1 LysR family transcriptional regulator [Pigmentiphaga litoralis]
MNLTLRQLRAFTAVADTGSFTAAAATLHLTQSALSVLIREMEADLGVRLFDRHTRRVVLSEAGREFQPAVQRMLGDLATAVSGLTDLRDKRRGVLRLAAPQFMACTWMPPVIAAFRARYPAIEVRLADTPPEHLLAGIPSGEVELAIGQDIEVDDTFERHTLFKDRHWLVCRADHAFARRRQVAWTDLADETFIAPTRDFLRRVLPELDTPAREALSASGTQSVSYITTALGMTEAGLGVTVCPSYAARTVQAHGLVMVPLIKPAFHRTICVYGMSRRAPSPAAQSFIDVLHEHVAQQAASKSRVHG